MTKPLSNQNSYRQYRYGESKRDIIIEAIVKDISSGKFARGTKIPNRALLAKRFDVNRKTIDKAINKLIVRKVLYTVKGVGTFVDHTALLTSDSFYSDRLLKIEIENPDFVLDEMCFQIGSSEINPFYFLRNCMESISALTLRLIKQVPDKWKRFYSFGEKLMHLMREDLSAREGKYYKEDNFIVLSGKYHALRSILRLLAGYGNIAVLAEPVPIALRMVFQEVGVEVWTLPRTKKGIEAISVEALSTKVNKAGKQIGLVYTNLQADYAEVGQSEIRKAMAGLLQVTEQVGAFLLEEYEDHEVSYQRQIVFADISAKPVGHVISVRSFSKLLPMYNELRMILAPKTIIDALIPAKQIEVNYGSLYEKLAIRMLQKNIFASVSQPVTFHFKNVRDSLVSFCEKRMSDWAIVFKPCCGCTFWLVAKDHYEFCISTIILDSLQLYYNNFNRAATNEKITTRYLQIGFGEGNSRNIELALEHIVEEMFIRYSNEDISADKSD